MTEEFIKSDEDVPATDGFILKASLFIPKKLLLKDESVKAQSLVLIASATGVKREYYINFAKYLVIRISWMDI